MNENFNEFIFDKEKLENIEEENIKKEIVDTEDNRNDCNIIRDENGKITGYEITSYRKNKEPFYCILNRVQTELLFNSYCTQGLNLSKAAISPDFAEFTTHDLGRIIKAFGLYKYDLPFPLHVIEEETEEQILKRVENLKVKKLQKKLEKSEQTAKDKITKELYSELQEYKKLEKIVSNINIDFKNAPIIKHDNAHEPTNKSLLLYLADMHIGAKCESDTLYPNPWDKEELYRRLKELLNRISSLGRFDTIILNMLGDNLDGMDNQTARRDHFMPQNMDNNEQIDTFLEVMLWFISNLKPLANNVKIYSVPCGNHDGIVGKVATMALQQSVKRLYGLEFVLFQEYRDYYTFNGHIFSLEHGKDPKFHKKGLPLELNDKTKVFLQEWLRFKGIAQEENIHFIKGDLHSNALSTCEWFTYRNVLSLFGASDYSNMNFSRNSYGVSYDMFIGDNLVSGTFENL